jgi:hypothetical protein
VHLRRRSDKEKGMKANLEEVAYHGGSVVRNPAIFLIYYGAIDPAKKMFLDTFATNVGRSDWWKILTTYNDTIGSIQGSLNYRGSTVVIPTASSSAPAALQWGDVANIVSTAISSGQAPTDSTHNTGMYFTAHLFTRSMSTFELINSILLLQKVHILNSYSHFFYRHCVYVYVYVYTFLYVCVYVYVYGQRTTVYIVVLTAPYKVDGMCERWCGWHSYISSGVVFAVIGDPATDG